ncbi:MAG: hypothetical protein U1F57_09380 [bacterium]
MKIQRAAHAVRLVLAVSFLVSCSGGGGRGSSTPVDNNNTLSAKSNATPDLTLNSDSNKQDDPADADKKNSDKDEWGEKVTSDYAPVATGMEVTRDGRVVRVSSFLAIPACSVRVLQEDGRVFDAMVPAAWDAGMYRNQALCGLFSYALQSGRVMKFKGKVDEITKGNKTLMIDSANLVEQDTSYAALPTDTPSCSTPDGTMGCGAKGGVAHFEIPIDGSQPDKLCLMTFQYEEGGKKKIVPSYVPADKSWKADTWSTALQECTGIAQAANFGTAVNFIGTNEKDTTHLLRIYAVEVLHKKDRNTPPAL